LSDFGLELPKSAKNIANLTNFSKLNWDQKSKVTKYLPPKYGRIPLKISIYKFQKSILADYLVLFIGFEKMRV